MSVATVASEPANKVTVSRAGKNPAASGDEHAAGFKSLVKDDCERDTAGPRKSEGMSGNGDRHRDETENQGAQGLWQRFGALFERAAATAEEQSDAAVPDAAAEESGSDADAASVEADSAVGAGIAQPAAVAAENRTETTGEQVKAEPRPAAMEPEADSPPQAIVERSAKETPAVASAAGAASVSAAVTLQGERQPNLQLRAANDTARPGTTEPDQDNGQKAATAAIPEERASGREAREGYDDGRGRERGNHNAAQFAGGGRIAGATVVSQQVTPTPAFQVQPAPMSETGSAFATSIAGEMQAVERSEAANLGGLTRPGATAPMTTLRIQLNPAELGMVTARLSGNDAQMSIEITVDNAEARHRLTADSDSIVTALRGMGIEIDRITVQQSQSGSGTAPNGAGRGNEFSESGGERQDQASRQGSERGNGENPQGGRNGANAEAAGDGVYI